MIDKKIIVTGGAGFIGSNLISKLNSLGKNNIIVVDDLSDGKKISNLSNLDIYDFISVRDFYEHINLETFKQNEIEVIFHQGACSSTTEWNGDIVMTLNYDYSKKLLELANVLNSQFIYASSASVYGINDNDFSEDFKNESPVNLYAYSKFQFDQYIRKTCSNYRNQVVGLRYFNVYGPNESHKKKMASTIFHFNNQLLENGYISLFKGTEGYKDGEQTRDFIYVDDCVNLNLWFYKNKKISGIYNAGTGISRTFNDVAINVINWHKKHSNIKGKIEYIEFPEELKNYYQNFTKADLKNLKNCGYMDSFNSLEQGISKYLSIINNA